ncbi:hypothetical protein [Spiroplasma endosymbiont of Othius punctulatus]|uniref:hypothetical protein n=1 Tax=Spiroplasma endosymbiont of Othius punctulatus TaxID=3066289 RepID=UPI0030CEB654
MEKVLLYFALKYKGDWDKVYKALETKEKIEMNVLTEAIKSIRCNWTTIISSDYPEALKYTFKPPFVIFYIGDLRVLNTTNNVMSFVNSNDSINQVDDQTHVGLIKSVKNLSNKSFLVLDNGIYTYMLENESQTSELVLSESYNDFEIPKNSILKNQLRFVSSISNSVVIDEYDETVIEEINSFSTNEDFKIFVKNKNLDLDSKFSNVFIFNKN